MPQIRRPLPLPHGVRRATGVALSGAVVVTAALLVAVGSSPNRSIPALAAPAPPCPTLPSGLPTLCPTSTTSTPTTTQTTTPTRTSTNPPPTSRTTSTTFSTFTFTQTSSFAAPPPTLPPPTPGAPPAPPELEVQTIRLDPATTESVPAGSTMSVHVTLEATRGSDTYSVPNAKVDFNIVSASGHGAKVDPTSAMSSDTGDLVVSVHTGDGSGATVVQASSGSARNRLSIITVGATSTSSTAFAPLGQTAPTDTGSRHRTIIGVLVVIALVGLTAVLLSSGRLPWRRRPVWGRRSTL